MQNDTKFNLYYIKCKHQNKDIYNVGDIYGKFLVKNLINDKVIQTYHGKDVFQIVGSLIRDSMDNSIILGTGILTKKDQIKSFQDCHLVRGKISLNKIKESHPDFDYCNVVLGDPGLTLSYFIDRKIPKKYDYGIVLHYLDDSIINEYFTNECLGKVRIINVNNPDVIDFSNQMLSCKKILSSSLHGIIFSHSLGIEAYWIRLDKSKLPVDDVKYYDYLSIYDMDHENVCNTINTKLEYNDLKSLKPLVISQHDIDSKKSEIFTHIINILTTYGYDIKPDYNNVIYDNNVGIKLLCEQLSGSNKFCINRIGGIELDAYCDYLINGYNTSSIPYQNMFKFCGYYDVDREKDMYDSYMKEYIECLNSSTLITVANSKLTSKMKFITITDMYYIHREEIGIVNVLSSLAPIKKIAYHILESFSYFDVYYPLLEGKKILVISPFEREIRSQLEKKDKLFKDFLDFKYPNFASIEYVNTYLTTNDYTIPHKNWKETFEHYKDIIKTKDFDICLLICGAYAYPLANYIYNILNKSTIHIGGIGQLFFGIKGGRYQIPYFTRMMNEHWVYPNTIIEKNAPGVPNGDGLLGYFERE